MKVIFLTREGYKLSGARVRCYGFARELSKYGWQTQVFSFADNLGAKYAEQESEMSWLMKLRYNLSAFKTLIKEDRRTILFLQRVNYHALAPLVTSVLHKNRVVFDCDDWNIRENPRYYCGLFPSSKMEYVTRNIARYSTVCIAASSFLKEYLSNFSKKVNYIPTGVDTDLFYPRPKCADSGIIFSWIGTAYHPEMKENLLFILSCFSILAEEFKNIFLCLAGEGRYYDEIKIEAAKLKCSKKIIVGPWVDPDNMPEYLSRIDIGLLPLIQDSRFNKAKSPTKLFEYMAMAKPVVASRIGEAESIVGDGQTGFLASNKDEFIYRMKVLIEDAKLRNDLGFQARKKVQEEYSFKVLAGKLNALLEDI